MQKMLCIITPNWNTHYFKAGNLKPKYMPKTDHDLNLLKIIVILIYDIDSPPFY